MNKYIILILTFLTLKAANIFAMQLPDYYYTFRDAMYNFEKSPIDMEHDLALYTSDANSQFSSYEHDIVMARLEYIMGRVYFYHKDKVNARLHYEKGIDYAASAVKVNKCAESLLIYAENVSAACTVKPVGWVMVWGAKIAGWDKKILKLDATNAAALYMLNSQDVYAPKPFCNWGRGLKKMSAMLDNTTLVFDKDDKFNVISAIGYVYSLKKDKENAKLWLEKSLTLYPGNKFVKGLIDAL